MLLGYKDGMRKILLSGGALLTLSLVMTPVAALAQDVVMRRPIPKSMSVNGGASWQATPWVIYDGSNNPVNAGDACGDYVERRVVSCVDGSGKKIDEMFCRGQEKPASERQARHDAGCTYSWQTGQFVDPGDSCTLNETQTRSVTCQRDQDSVVMSDSFCTTPKPDTTRTVEDFATCTHSWKTGAYVDPGASCTNTERQERKVSCERDLDKVEVTDGMCDAGARPQDFQLVRDISACTYAWKTGEFQDPGPSCTRSETQTRSVTCHRSLNEELASDASCNAASKPTTTQTVEDYATCSFTAVQWTEWSPSSTCSAEATKTRTAKCQRSNDGGEIVPDQMCIDAGVALSETVPEANYSSCTNSWDRSGFVDPGDNCGPETWTQTVWCKRDLDNHVMPDASCNAALRPPTTEVAHDISSCGYTPTNWSGWSWNSTCSATATRTRKAQCLRGDGQTVADAECTGRGVALTESVTEPNYSTCTSSWSYNAWGDPGASCTAAEPQYRSAWCRRDLDGAAMPDASCDAAQREPLSRRVADYSGCEPFWHIASNWGNWSSTCSTSATRTREIGCFRTETNCAPGSAGYWENLGNGNCSRKIGNADCQAYPNSTRAGYSPASASETAAIYASCSNSWDYSAFVDPGNSCGNETWTRTARCRRDLDDATMPDASCGARESLTDTRYDVSGCGYSPDNWSGWNWNSQCSATATRTRTAQCRRGDGQIVPNAECTNRGVSLTESVTEPNYSTCTSSWAYNAWGDPGASCTAAEPQYRSAWCRRDLDGAAMPDAACNVAQRESLSRTVADYSGCQPFYWEASNWSNWSSTCSANATRTRDIGCFRGETNCTPGSPNYWSDWGNGNCARRIDISECQAYPTSTREGFSPASGTETAAIYSTCSNSWDYSAFVDPGNSCGNETWTRTARCRRDLDNATMPDASCGARQSLTDTRYDVSGCGYSAVSWSGWSWNSQCSATATRTRTAQCQRGDGQIVPNAECTNRGVALSESVQEPNYSACTSNWAYGGWGDPGASCTAAETQYRSAWCRRDLDGAAMPDASCNAAQREGLSRTVADYSGCQPFWYDASGWGNWSSTCSANATRTREIGCFRGESNCTPGTPGYWSDWGNGYCARRISNAECQAYPTSTREGYSPASGTETAAIYSSCSNSWARSGFVDPGNNCGYETWTQSVWCKRDLDGAVQPDAACNASTRPSNTEVAYDISACGYSPANWSGWSWNSNCSSAAVRTRTAQCQRSDGQIVGNAECTNRGVGLTESVQEANYSACSNSWAESGFVDPGNSCGNETWTQSVWCKRDLDGAWQPDASCNAGNRPAWTSVRYDVSGCGYYAVNWTGWNWNSSCSPNAVRTRTAQCQRGDGHIVDNAECTNRGVALSESVQEGNYSSCSSNWAVGGWSDPGASCTVREVQTRAVWCRRDVDGAGMPDASCNAGTRPGSTQVVEDYSGCSPYYYTATDWTGWSSYCSSNATRTRQIGCFRNETDCRSTDAYFWGFHNPGASNDCSKRIPDGNCSMPNSGWAGYSPANGSETAAVYASCGFYADNWTGWNWNSQCSDHAVRTRTAQCRRTDGTIVDNSECTNRGIGLSESVQEANYSQCGYTPSSSASSCSNGWQTVTNSCRRSDGAQVDPGYCGLPAQQGQACTSTSWQAGGWGGWGACQPNGTQQQWRDVYCEANNGGNRWRVGNENCAGGAPSNVNTQGCAYYTYQSDYGPWTDWNSHCSTNATRTRDVACHAVNNGNYTRVGDQECTNRGIGMWSRSESAQVLDGCGYTAHYGGWTQCQSNNQRAQGMNLCQRSDGASVAGEECVNRGQPWQNFESCNSNYAPGVTIAATALYYTCYSSGPYYYGCSYVNGIGYVTEVSCSGTVGAGQCASGSAERVPVNRGTASAQCATRCR